MAKKEHSTNVLTRNPKRPAARHYRGRVGTGFDADEGLGFDQVKKAAFEIRDALEGIGLQSAAMVTGGKAST
ncbi:hypothetical protein ACFORG_01260 [Lutimaribacter marinistellae]|uniref:Uncharacterized protein n=1 Tax=Lutimaribacter marinistellae TaxID=1820329 RepID=A0ABV7TB12_9RHOB